LIGILTVVSGNVRCLGHSKNLCLLTDPNRNRTYESVHEVWCKNRG